MPSPIFHGCSKFAQALIDLLRPLDPNGIRERKAGACHTQAVAPADLAPGHVPVERRQRQLRLVREDAEEVFPKVHVASVGSALWKRLQNIRVRFSKRRPIANPFHAGQSLIEQLPTGEWVERAQYFEAVAVTGEGVFDTLKAVSKLVLKSLT